MFITIVYISMAKYVILHMFNKHVNDISQKLNEIASNGFTHILISPITICNMDTVINGGSGTNA